MKVITVLSYATLIFSVAVGVPFITRQTCEVERDCLLGFPSTISSVICDRGICAARNVLTCTSSSDCKDALTTCISGTCSFGATGAPCGTRADCGVGHVCSSAGRCERGKPGDSCGVSTAVQCYNGLTCVDAKCRPGSFNERCVLDRNCQQGLRCNRGRCDYGTRPPVPVLNPWTYEAPEMHLTRQNTPDNIGDFIEPSIQPFGFDTAAIVAEPSADPTAVPLSRHGQAGTASSEILIAMPSNTPIPSTSARPTNTPTPTTSNIYPSSLPTANPTSSASASPLLSAVLNAVNSIPELTANPAGELSKPITVSVVLPEASSAPIPGNPSSSLHNAVAVSGESADVPEPSMEAELVDLVDPIPNIINAEAVAIEVTAVPIPVAPLKIRKERKTRMAANEHHVFIS